MRHILLLLLLAVQAVRAEAVEVGVSYFALNGFNLGQCERTAETFAGINTVRVAILWRSFDRTDGFSCLKWFLNRFSDRVVIIEVHASNESGRRMNRLAPYEFLSGLSVRALNQRLASGHEKTLEKIRANAEEIKEFFRPYARDGFSLIITTGLEDNFSDDAFGAVYRIFREVYGYGTEIYRNPVGSRLNGRALFGANGVELHGLQSNFEGLPKGRLCIRSNDGNSIDFTDRSRDENKLKISGLPSYIRRDEKRRCKIFLWFAEPQGRTGRQFKPPRSRRFLLDSKNIFLINEVVGTYDN